MLPLGGRTLTEWSIVQAIGAGLFPVVTSDSDAILNATVGLGGQPVRRPVELCGGNRHIDSIKHAVNAAVTLDTKKNGAPVVLLQPTSPFRIGGIIQRCLDANRRYPDKVIYSGRTIHYADRFGKPVSMQVWDGCVAVYPHDKIGHQDDAVFVENEHINMLQIDTDKDYIQACILFWRLAGCWMPIDRNEAETCRSALSPILNGNTVTVVGRGDGAPIDQSRPVVWINHCQGWDGGRADVLVVVASKNLINVGINPEMAEVALKAKVVIIRDFGQGEWVLKNLKTTAIPILTVSTKNQVTTGAFACSLVHLSGGVAETIGFQRGVSRIPYCYQCFADARASDEIAILEVSGKSRSIDKNPN